LLDFDVDQLSSNGNDDDIRDSINADAEEADATDGNGAEKLKCS
jgi:hypothetical protein